MPKGPQGQKRPADVIGAAIRVARIATGEEYESPITDNAKQMAAGVNDRLWSLEDVIIKIDEIAPAPKVRGPYKKRG